jgi:hypothetical protein
MIGLELRQPMKSIPRTPFTSTTASVSLDFMRGIAAMLVCLEHWRNLLYIDYPQIGPTALFLRSLM